MKFDDQLFNLSAEIYNKIKNFNNNTNKEVKRKQDKVLKILLTKFKEQLKLTKDIDKGILKVKFESKRERNIKILGLETSFPFFIIFR